MSADDTPPNLAEVKSAAMSRLADEATDQAVVITVQGTQVGIAVSVKPAAYAIWARLLRGIADEMENGPETSTTFVDETIQGKRAVN